jgi:hypothetical protein
VAEEFEHSADTIPDYRASQVADVHMLGNIRAGKIDNDDFRLSLFFYTKPALSIGVDFDESSRNKIRF